MKKLLAAILLSVAITPAIAQLTPFEKTKGTTTATYAEAIAWYKAIDSQSPKVLVKTMGTTDAGYSLNLVLVSSDAQFDIARWKQQHKIILLINNGIHPGEPDGIDASMMLVRDIAQDKIKLPANVVLAVIPVYNIGGSLNRTAYSRVNQNGPAEYGFRGNAQNLDLNRDFTKSDSKEARSFAQLFHLLDPDIFMDNHVSDGADYQHTMTLITTQYDKLGGRLGTWLKDTFEPDIYKGMAAKKWELIPYVDFEYSSPDKGMQMFYDPPRYSSGYTTLFQTIGFISETHMLKPYADRVQSTYDLMLTMIEKAAANAGTITKLRKEAREAVAKQKTFPLSWTIDTTRHSAITFKGYAQGIKTSEATGLQTMFYDRTKPYTKQVTFYDTYKPANTIQAPTAYIIPQGWYAVTDLLQLNKVVMRQFTSDTTIEVQVYHIDDYKASPRAYEKHHRNSGVKVSATMQKIQFLKGDYYIPMNQPANRYLAEMLEPTGDDSFFAWNFFDGILQQKEGYSDYRWEDVAAAYLKVHPELKQKLEEKKAADSKFAADGPAQLDFIYKNSPYYEPAHLRYPVYRLL